MKKYPFVSKIATITGLALGAFALSALATGTWTAPSAAAPNGNVDAPINVGGGTALNIYSQTKTGFLTLANFIFNPTLAPGSVTAGSVLTAKDTSGTVGWAAPSSGGSFTGVTCTGSKVLKGINANGTPICVDLNFKLYQYSGVGDNRNKLIGVHTYCALKSSDRGSNTWLYGDNNGTDWTLATERSTDNQWAICMDVTWQ